MKCPDCGHTNPEELERCEKCESFLDDSEATGIRPAPSGNDSRGDSTGESDVTGLRPTPPEDSEATDSEAATGYQPVPAPDAAAGSRTPSSFKTPAPGSPSLI